MTLVAPPRSARFHLVYEAHPAPAEGIGAFLTVAANGVDALRTLGTDQSAIAAGFPTTAITVWSSAQGPAQAT
jgi:FAD-dependent urate hydroxylase